MVLREIASGLIVGGILLAALAVLGIELWEKHQGKDKEDDGTVRELIEDVVEHHTGIDLDV